MKRRAFLGAAAMSAVGAAVARAQAGQPAGTPQPPVESPTPSQITGAPVTQAEAPGATMEGEGYRPVRRDPKPGARPQLDDQQRDAVERQLSCPCPCTLDVFTCRTSMPCGFSPRMHGDVVALIQGGYSGDEIIAAFEQVYGEKVLMAPKKTGFNWAGYAAPFAVIGGGGVVLAGLMRRWSQRAAAVAEADRAEQARHAARNGRTDPALDATPDELARLEAAVRAGDDDPR